MKALFRRALGTLGRTLDALGGALERAAGGEHDRFWTRTLEAIDALAMSPPGPRLAPGTSPSPQGRQPMNKTIEDLEARIAEALLADRSIDELETTAPSDLAPRDAVERHESAADRLFEVDRKARNRLIAALEPLLKRRPGEGVIVVAGDGSACALAVDSDGLVIVPADRVIRLDRAETGEQARAMVADLAEQLRVRRP